MRFSRIAVLTLILMLLSLSVSAQRDTRGGGPAPIDDSNAFIHVSTLANTSFNETSLDSEGNGTSPLTDNITNAMVFVTHNIIAGSAAHAEPFGVYYFTGGWSIFNQISANNMPLNVAFNVQVMGKGDNVFIHTATAANSSSHITYLNHPLLNNTPSAIVMVTPRWEGVYNPNEIGVYYTGAEWAIFNQNGAAMPVNAMFNVQVAKNAAAYTHVATAGNIVDTSKTEIDNAFLNNNPSAQFLVTQNWTVGGGIYNDEAIAVEYNSAAGRWRIINSDGSAMPVNAGFNILITHTGDVFGDGVLMNGGFEVPATTKTTAVKWNTTNAGTGSKRVCNRYAPVAPTNKTFALVGECSYLLKGLAGTTRKIVQTVNLVLPPSANNAIDFRGLVKGVNVVGAQIKGVVTLSNDTKVSYTVSGASLNGSYDWKSVNAFTPFNSATPPKRVQLTIRIGGGSLYLDNLSSAIYIGTR